MRLFLVMTVSSIVTVYLFYSYFWPMVCFILFSWAWFVLECYFAPEIDDDCNAEEQDNFKQGV